MNHIVRRRGFVVALIALAGSGGVTLDAQQAPGFAGLYRMFQAGAEVGREQFRRSPGLAEMSVVVPLLGLKLDSRTEFASAGTFRRFEAQIYNAAGDSLRGSYTVTADGDTLRTVRTMQRIGQSGGAVVPGR